MVDVKHIRDGDTDVVSLTDLRVLLSPDSGSWFAQALEIDYFAAGKTVEEAKQNFAKGLVATIKEHINLNGNLETLKKAAPQESWDEYYTASKECLRTSFGLKVELQDIKEELPEAIEFPFDRLAYMEQKDPEAAAAR
jgi:hypothetical protein